MNPPGSVPALLLVYLAVFSFSSLSAQAFDEYYWYRGEPLHLKARKDRISVKPASGKSVKTVESNLSGRGTLEPAHGPSRAGLFTLELTSKAASSDDLEEILSDLQARDDVAYAAPIYGEEILVPDQFVLRWSPEATPERKRRIHSKYGVRFVREFDPLDGLELCELKPGGSLDALEVANRYAESDLCSWAHPNFILKRDQRFIPNDSLFDQQWHLHQASDADMDCPEAWDITKGVASIVIAIIDSGVETAHPDLSPNLVAASLWRDFSNGDNDPNPPRPTNCDAFEIDEIHGTVVAGVAAARGNNTIGVSGSCPECGILPILNASSPDFVSGDIDSINWGGQHADVLCNSWGYPTTLPGVDGLVTAVDNAATTGRGGKGCVVIFATGNESENIDTINDLSNLPNAIGVGATTLDDTLADYSNFGPSIDLVAPGGHDNGAVVATDITGTAGFNPNCPGETVDDDYTTTFGIGTSFSCPALSGVAGLVLSINPNLTRAQVQQVLEDTADKVHPADASYDMNGHSERYGYGRVNAGAAVAAAQAMGSGTPLPTATPTPTSPPGSSTATPTPTLDADVDGDGHIDAIDLLHILSQWHDGLDD